MTIDTSNPETAREAALIARRNELLTVKEYAYVTREHVQTVRRRIRLDAKDEREGRPGPKRQPGAKRIGGQWRIDLSEATTTPGTTTGAAAHRRMVCRCPSCRKRRAAEAAKP